MALEPGPTVGPYAIVTPIGAGGQGEVDRPQTPTATRRSSCYHRLSVGGHPMRNFCLLTVFCFQAFTLVLHAQDQSEYIH